MIVRMKKLDLLLYHREKERFLAELQDLGVVHIVENKNRESGPGQDTAALAKRCDAALKVLKGLGAKSTPVPSAADGHALLEAYEKAESRMGAVEQEIQAQLKDEASLALWGEFDPALLRTLASRGVELRFFRAPQKKFGLIDKKSVSLDVIGIDQNIVHFVTLGEVVLPDNTAEEVTLPARSLSAVRSRTAELRAEQVQLRDSLVNLASQAAVLEDYGAQCANLSRFQIASLDLSAEASGTLLSLSGWFPAKKAKALAECLKGYSAWYEIADPDDQDDVPVLVQNGPFSKLFEPIMRLYMLPSYREMDPTPLFAPFFTFFVGLCLGDVAYGTIIFVASAIARKKAPQGFRPYASLLMILGGMVVFCGILLNSCFGNALFGGPGIPEGTAFFPGGAQYLSPLSPVETSMGTKYPAMSFALLVGFLQMIYAMVLQLINRFRLGGAMNAILPVSYMMMMIGALVWAAHTNPFSLKVSEFAVGRYAIGPIILMVPVIVAKVLTYGGLALLLLFNNPGKKIFWRPLTGLWEFYNFATGNLGYLLSYIRLFALGLCGGLLGATFNQMALGLIATDAGHNWLSPLALVTVLILVAGHALNFGLSLVGAFVHPLRLTFVEFYQTLQFSGGGREFVPFSSVKLTRESQPSKQ